MASPASSAPRPVDAASADAQSAPDAPAASAARVACELLAVTTSDEFLLELGEALAGRAAMRPVESLDDALEHLGSSRRLQLIAFDIRGVTDVPAAIERARAKVPHITVLAFADGSVEPAQSRSLQGAEVFALLPVPIDRRKTAAALESAIIATEKRGPVERSGARAAGAASVVGASSTVAPAKHLLGLPPLVLVAAGIAVALVLAAGAWFFTRGDGEAALQPTGSSTLTAEPLAEEAMDEASEARLHAAPAEISLVQGSIDELLEKARLAMRQRRYTEPAGDNALVYFRSAVALDASNAEANDGLARVGGVLVARVDEAIGGKQFDEATAALSAAKNAIPGDSRLAPLETRLFTTQVEAALAEDRLDRATSLTRVAQKSGVVPANVIEAWRLDIAERQLAVRVRRATELAAERLGEGRLLEPENDSAKRHLAQLRELAPTGAATRRLEKQFADACLRKARESLLAGRNTEADRWLAEAQGAGVSGSDVAAFRKEVAGLRQRAAEGDRIAALARARLEGGRLTEPENDSAAHHLNALRAAEESHTALAPLRRELAARLVERATAAARAGDASRLEADLAAARRFGASAKEVQAVQQLLASERPAPTPERRVSLQSLLKRSRYVAPEYPTRALEKGISGSVTLEYVVDVNGETRDHKIAASEPEGVFDRAALAAVRRWRYEPVVVDEVPVEVPTRALIRFEAPSE